MDHDEEALLDEQLTALIDLFPETDIGVLLEAVCHSGGSREQAIDHVLAHQVTRNGDGQDGESSSPRKDDLTVARADTVQELRNYYPELDRASLYSFVLAHEEESTETLKELLGTALRHQRGRMGRKRGVIPVDETHFQIGTRGGAGPSSTTVPPRHTVVGLRDTIIEALQGDLDFASNNNETDMDPHALRDHANVLHAERVALLRKAAAAYATHKGGPIAQYYSMEAASVGQRIEELHKRAAYHTFVRLNRDLPSHTIDLHGLTVSQGLAVVDIIIDYLQSLGSDASGMHQRGLAPDPDPFV